MPDDAIHSETLENYSETPGAHTSSIQFSMWNMFWSSIVNLETGFLFPLSFISTVHLKHVLHYECV